MNNDYEISFQRDLDRLNEEIVLDATEVEPVELAMSQVRKLDSDMDGWDYVACVSCAVLSTFITTNEEFGKWLDEVHSVANGQMKGNDPIQNILGTILHHQGDAMDRYESPNGDKYYVLFHRLLSGHDILATRGGFTSDNPFSLMINQYGMAGILQAVRHLIADTFSKQGLPLPSSSYFDTDKFDEVSGRTKPWNSLIDLVQELSSERYGNKGQAGEIYKHLLTIRAQDIAGGMLAKGVCDAYFRMRNITDRIRVAQVRLVAYTASFYAEAIVGAMRQKGIPFINYPLGAAMGKEVAALLLASNGKTFELGKETKRLNKKAEEISDQHNQLKALLNDDFDFLGE